jgi:aryl-alcohol dehydrogenase-like predicted oxidoreductase
LVDALAKIAQEMGIGTVELCIAWVLAKGNNILPLVGARTRRQLSQALGALSVKWSPADLERLSESWNGFRRAETPAG